LCPAAVGREMWKALLPSLRALVLNQVPFGWWYRGAFWKSFGLVLDLHSREDHPGSVLNAFWIARSSLRCGLLK